MKKKPNILLSIAEASKMTTARISTAFHERYVLRTKAFAEQGKLAYALSIKKLGKGKSIQGILTAKGSPAGSVGNARKAAAIIEALVITDLITEETFDNSVTYRIVRMANKVLGLDKGAAKILPPESVAEIINDASSAGEAADTLECWNEHKCSPAEHIEKLKATKAAEKAQADASAIALAKEEAEAQKNADAVAEDDAADDAEEAEKTPTENKTPEEETPEDKAPAEEKTPTALPAATPAPVESIIAPEPEGVTLENILERILKVRVDAEDLSVADTTAVLDEVNDFVTDLLGVLEVAAKAEAKAAA
jgi:hypothetical protein